ncbi:hypothetical protein J6590_011213 [Homalodisca vitripennis]|nr:hypothetical protein J6590_011213 [Homalodisca vitripennis]
MNRAEIRDICTAYLSLNAITVKWSGWRLERATLTLLSVLVDVTINDRSPHFNHESTCLTLHWNAPPRPYCQFSWTSPLMIVHLISTMNLLVSQRSNGELERATPTLLSVLVDVTIDDRSPHFNHESTCLTMHNPSWSAPPTLLSVLVDVTIDDRSPHFNHESTCLTTQECSNPSWSAPPRPYCLFSWTSPLMTVHLTSTMNLLVSPCSNGELERATPTLLSVLVDVTIDDRSPHFNHESTCLTTVCSNPSWSAPPRPYCLSRDVTIDDRSPHFNHESTCLTMQECSNPSWSAPPRPYCLFSWTSPLMTVHLTSTMNILVSQRNNGELERATPTLLSVLVDVTIDDRSPHFNHKSTSHNAITVKWTGVRYLALLAVLVTVTIDDRSPHFNHESTCGLNTLLKVGLNLKLFGYPILSVTDSPLTSDRSPFKLSLYRHVNVEKPIKIVQSAYIHPRQLHAWGK